MQLQRHEPPSKSFRPLQSLSLCVLPITMVDCAQLLG